MNNSIALFTSYTSQGQSLLRHRIEGSDALGGGWKGKFYRVEVEEMEEIMITYYKLPLETLREMANEKGLELDYHPAESRIKKGAQVIATIEPPRMWEEINEFLSTYEREENHESLHARKQ